MNHGMVELLYKDLGCVDYLAALELQGKLVELRQQQLVSDTLLFVEHPHVYTLVVRVKRLKQFSPLI